MCRHPPSQTKRMKTANVNDTGLTPSTIKLKRIIGTAPAYRMLTPYEIELLRQSQREVAEVVGEILAKKNNKE